MCVPLYIGQCLEYLVYITLAPGPISCSKIIFFLSAFSVCSCVRKGNYCCKEAICSESNSPNSLSPIESICKTSLQLSPYSGGLWRLWSFDVRHTYAGASSPPKQPRQLPWLIFENMTQTAWQIWRKNVLPSKKTAWI